MYPLPMHKNAYEKSKAIVCEKSLKLLEDAFEYKELPKPKCETKAIDENIEAGKKLGLLAIGVTYGIRSRDFLKKLEPSFLIDSLPEILKILDDVGK